jgi:hypothetical protein
VLLVEDPNDKYGHVAAAAKTGRDLGPATIVSCVGKTKIPYFQILCVAFGVDFFCVYDFDQGGEEEGRDELIKDYAGAATLYFTYQTSFEKVMGKSKLKQILTEILQSASLPAQVDECLTRICKWIG